MELNINQISIVKNVAEVQLASLFDSSVDSMDAGTWAWPNDIDTNEKKFVYFKSIIEKLLSDPDNFAFKRTVNGNDVSFNLGKKHGTSFGYYIGLATGIGGSKAWIFDDRVTPQQMQFLKDNQFDSIILNTVRDSDTEKHVVGRYTVLGAEISIIGNYSSIRNTLIKFPTNTI